MDRGRLIVVSGPSGSGKGTICARAIDDIERLEFSISMATRAPRRGEIDGKHYYFVTKEAFEHTIASDGFFEYAEVYGNYYGTPKADVLRKLDEGTDIILDIDTQGAKNIKKAFPDAVLVFVLPPSLAELRHRLESRSTDSPEVIERRMTDALLQIGDLGEYQYCIVNDDLEKAIVTFEAILLAERARLTDPGQLIERYKEES